MDKKGYPWKGMEKWTKLQVNKVTHKLSAGQLIKYLRGAFDWLQINDAKPLAFEGVVTHESQSINHDLQNAWYFLDTGITH